jgi:hypothetical protein
MRSGRARNVGCLGKMSLAAFLAACMLDPEPTVAVVAAAATAATHAFLVAAVFLRTGARGPRAQQHARRALLWFVRAWPADERVVALVRALPTLCTHCWDDLVLFWNKVHASRPAVANAILALYATTLRHAQHQGAHASLPDLECARNRYGFRECLLRTPTPDVAPVTPPVRAVGVTALTSFAGSVWLVDTGMWARVCGAAVHMEALAPALHNARVQPLDFDGDMAVDVADAARCVVIVSPRSLHGPVHELIARAQRQTRAAVVYWEMVDGAWGELVRSPRPNVLHVLGTVPYTLDYLARCLEGAPLDEGVWLQCLAADPVWAPLADPAPSHCAVQ